jgi:hypothetical protein
VKTCAINHGFNTSLFKVKTFHRRRWLPVKLLNIGLWCIYRIVANIDINIFQDFGAFLINGAQSFRPL